jgi:hypothetical protein
MSRLRTPAQVASTWIRHTIAIKQPKQQPTAAGGREGYGYNSGMDTQLAQGVQYYRNTPVKVRSRWVQVGSTAKRFRP